MSHRVGQYVFALLIGLVIAVTAYRWITDPGNREERALQVNVVEASRMRLRSAIGIESVEIADTLAPNRVAGKAYIYPGDDGWSVSGYYRRDKEDRWHPYLMSLSSDLTLVSLKLQDKDPALIEHVKSDSRIEIVE